METFDKMKLERKRLAVLVARLLARTKSSKKRQSDE